VGGVSIIYNRVLGSERDHRKERRANDLTVIGRLPISETVVQCYRNTELVFERKPLHPFCIEALRAFEARFPGEVGLCQLRSRQAKTLLAIREFAQHTSQILARALVFVALLLGISLLMLAGQPTPQWLFGIIPLVLFGGGVLIATGGTGGHRRGENVTEDRLDRAGCLCIGSPLHCLPARHSLKLLAIAGQMIAWIDDDCVTYNRAVEVIRHDPQGRLPRRHPSRAVALARPWPKRQNPKEYPLGPDLSRHDGVPEGVGHQIHLEEHDLSENDPGGLRLRARSGARRQGSRRRDGFPGWPHLRG